MSLQIRVRIEPRAAILARKAVAGVVPVDITEENLQTLSDDQLAELAELVEQNAVVESPLVSEPTFDVVKSVLQARVEAKAKLRAAEEAAEADRRKAEARAAEEEAMRRRENKERDAARARAIAEWVEKNGDDDQRERLAEGLLSEVEIIDEVMHQIFEINEDEYVPLRKEQACDCERGCAGSVKFLIEPVPQLDSRQFSTLTRIRDSAPDGAKIELRLHKATCPECKCTPMARVAALVSLEWNGWLLKKEYSLG